MELLYIVLIAVLVVCIFLALLICCLVNTKNCPCLDLDSIKYTDADSSGPTKTKTTVSSREVTHSEYYTNSTPVLRSGIQDFRTNGDQSTPLLSPYQSKPQQFGSGYPMEQRQSEINDNTFTTSTFYPSSKNYPSEEKTKASYVVTTSSNPAYPTKRVNSSSMEIIDTSYPIESHSSTSRVSQSQSRRNIYASELPRHDTAFSTKAMNYSSESAGPYYSSSATQLFRDSDDNFYQPNTAQNSLRKSSSQTSLYENN